MATEAALAVERRTQTGTSHSRRLRLEGKVPANLYGLDQEAVALTVDSDLITPAVIAGHRVIDIDLDGSVEKAMIREVQWDTFLTHILHVDLQRIDASARLDVDVAVHTRGVANEGVLDQPLHSVELNCPAYAVPDQVDVRVGSLRIGEQLTVADLTLPEGVTCNLPGDSVVVRVTEAKDVEIVQEDVSAAAEPELIGRSAEPDDEA
ncbi:MAG: 50S ribosomal protein L25 [Planctomycetota bacterium]|jgi:large subunit ribosomal protein L25